MLEFLLKFNLRIGMVHHRITEGTRWQITGMRHAGMSTYCSSNWTKSSKMLKKYRATNEVKDLPRPGRPHKTSQQEDRALLRLVKRRPFHSSTRLRQQWVPGRALSCRTVRNRLKAAGYGARRPIADRLSGVLYYLKFTKKSD